MNGRTSTVVGAFRHFDDLRDAIRSLRAEGYAELTVLSPVPLPEIAAALPRPPSPIRYFTLVGGIVGGLSGFALTIWTSVAWPIRTSGKPIVSIPPFLIIVFELTILFAALATLVGLLLFARLPAISHDAGDDPRFAADRFGLVVRCPGGSVGAVERLLRERGAEEVREERSS